MQDSPSESQQNPSQQPAQRKAVFSCKYLISGALMVAILAATMLLLFRNLSWQDVKQTILSARPAYLLAGFGMMLVYQLCIALSIRTLIRTFTGGHCSLGLSATAAFIGFYFNNITPSASGGQPMEMYYLNRRGINLSHSSMIFILLAIFYNITIIGAALIMLVWRYDLIRSSLGYIRYFMYFGLSFHLIATVLMVLLVVRPRIVRETMKAVSALLFKLRLIRNQSVYLRKVVTFSSGYRQNSAVLFKQPRLLLRLLVLHIFQVLSFYSVPYLVTRSFGGRSRMYLDSLALQSVLYISSSAVPTPGAVGITESGFVTMFASILPPHLVVPAMLLTRIIQLYGFLILSAVITIAALFRVNHGRTPAPPADGQTAGKDLMADAELPGNADWPAGGELPGNGYAPGSAGSSDCRLRFEPDETE